MSKNVVIQSSQPICNNPIGMVKKHNDSLSFCIDYRKVYTVPNLYEDLSDLSTAIIIQQPILNKMLVIDMVTKSGLFKRQIRLFKSYHATKDIEKCRIRFVGAKRKLVVENVKTKKATFKNAYFIKAIGKDTIYYSRLINHNVLTYLPQTQSIYTEPSERGIYSSSY